MESDLDWLQDIGRLDHYVEGDYHVDENGGMWVLEDIPVGVHADDYDRWGSQAGRVYLRIDQTEAFRRQMEHRLCNRQVYVQVGMTNSIVVYLLCTRFRTPSIKPRLPMAITIENQCPKFMSFVYEINMFERLLHTYMMNIFDYTEWW